MSLREIRSVSQDYVALRSSLYGFVKSALRVHFCSLQVVFLEMRRSICWPLLLAIGLASHVACFSLSENFAKSMISSLTDERAKAMLSNVNLKDLDPNKPISSQVLELLKKNANDPSLLLLRAANNSVPTAAVKTVSSQIDPSMKSFKDIFNPYLKITNVSAQCSEYLAVFTNALIAQHNWTYNGSCSSSGIFDA